jgi:O-antigen/teichoic acid export membrane protein
MKYLKLERFISSILFSKIFSSFIWSFIGSFISKLFTTLLFILIARLITLNNYGNFIISYNTLILIVSISGFGIGLTTTRLISKYRETEIIKTTNVISSSFYLTHFISFIFSLLFFLFSYKISKIININNVDILKYGSIFIYFFSLVSFQNSVLYGFGCFKEITIRNCIVGILNFIFVYICIYYFNTIGVILGLIISYAINYFLNYILIIKLLKKFNIIISFSIFLKEVRNIIKSSILIYFSEIIVGITKWYSLILLNKQINGSSEIGVYNITQQWALLVLFIPNSIGTTIFPFLSKIDKLKNNKRYNIFLKYIFLFNFLFTILPIVFILIFSRYIFSFYGLENENSLYVLATLLLSFLFNSFNNIIGHGLLSQGNNSIALYLNISWSFLYLIFTIIFLHFNQTAISIAKANLFSYFIIFLILLFYNFNYKITKSNFFYE